MFGALSPRCLPNFVCSFCSIGSIANEARNGCHPCTGNTYKFKIEDGVCWPCPDRFFASQQHDSCFTIDFLKPPTLAFSDKTVSISGISLRSLHGKQDLSSLLPINVSIILGKDTLNSGFVVVASALAIFNGNNWSYPLMKAVLGALSPASDFKWSLKLVQPAITDVVIMITDVNVSVVDVSPIIESFASSDIFFNGSNIFINCIPMPPAQVFFLPLFTASNLTQTMCVFLPATGYNSLSTFSQPGHFVSISNSLIQLRCELLSRGRLGPPYSKWQVRVILPDGRESPESSTLINVRCPPGMYIENNATAACKNGPCCLDCPIPMSMSHSLDSIGIQSCICQPGYYGEAGLSCFACPKSTKYGFVCTTAGLKFPLVKPGFYIDYSLLSQCTEEACNAVVKCPNAEACPGGGQKNCLNSESECYSNRSMGCTECCLGYYSDNFVCKKCPESRLIIILCLAILLLILFAILSSSMTFPPFVAVAKGLKLILSGLQSFSCIRLMAGLSRNSDGVLSGVNWPPVMLSTFEFMNTFTFSFDSLRPQCSLDFSPLDKLVLIAFGPFMVVAALLLVTVVYSLWKIHHICEYLKRSKLLSEHSSTHSSLLQSVAYCFLVSVFCLKFSRNNQVKHGPLWTALDPTSIERSDLAVIISRRRKTLPTLEESSAVSKHDQLMKLPRGWRKMVQDFEDAGVSKVMKTSVLTARLLISSSFSIFILTFQGVIETLLGTWDCKTIDNRKFLRSRPNVECAGNDMYFSMVIVSGVGIAIYTFVVPLCVVIVVKSRWAREIYAFSYVAYDQLFGFITNQYSSAHVTWEAINCIRKLVSVAIPMVIASSPITQALSNIVLFLVYAMFILSLKPMISSYLNKIEVLNSFNIIVSSFAAILFTVQYENDYVLQGHSRHVVGIALVVFISLTFSVSMRLIYLEFRQLFALHSNPFLSKWLRVISAKAGSSILLGTYLPISLLFINKSSSTAIHREFDDLDNKSKQALSIIDQSWFSSTLFSSFIGYFVLAWTKTKLRFQKQRHAGRYEIDDNLSHVTMAEPDYEFFMWMHKLMQRTRSWEPHEKELRHADFLELPKKFTVNYGKSDPPIAVCDSLLRISRAVDGILNDDHQKLLLALILSDGVMDVRSNLDNGRSDEYQMHMNTLIKSFKEMLFKNVDACELFRDDAEKISAEAVCSNARKNLYGAADSERIKLLHHIANTTLPQYHQLQKLSSDKVRSDRSGGQLPDTCNVPNSNSVRVAEEDSRNQRSASIVTEEIPTNRSDLVSRNPAARTRIKNRDLRGNARNNELYPKGTIPPTPGDISTSTHRHRDDTFENETNLHTSSAQQNTPTAFSKKNQLLIGQVTADSQPVSMELEEIVIDRFNDASVTRAQLAPSTLRTQLCSETSASAAAASSHSRTSLYNADSSVQSLYSTQSARLLRRSAPLPSNVRDIPLVQSPESVTKSSDDFHLKSTPPDVSSTLPIKTGTSSTLQAATSFVAPLAAGSAFSIKSSRHPVLVRPNLVKDRTDPPPLLSVGNEKIITIQNKTESKLEGERQGQPTYKRDPQESWSPISRFRLNIPLSASEHSSKPKSHYQLNLNHQLMKAQQHHDRNMEDLDYQKSMKEQQQYDRPIEQQQPGLMSKSVRTQEHLQSPRGSHQQDREQHMLKVAVEAKTSIPKSSNINKRMSHLEGNSM